MSELHDLTATEQLTLLSSKAVSSGELTSHYLERIGQHGARLGAFTRVFASEALTAADVADSSPRTGLLQGLPIGLKDLHPTAGLPTAMGSIVLRDWVPAVDAPVVGALRSAGVVVLGKTNAPEFGPTCYTESLVADPARTPYDERLSASGSSGGAAAAVAAGLMPFAHASDGLGSIRTPAATCGLVGFKPSRGRLLGGGSDYVGFAAEGPIARTVADAALFLDAVGPCGQAEMWTRGSWAPDSHREAASRPAPSGLRVGVLTDPGIDATVDAACLAAVGATAALLGGLGHAVEEVTAFPRLGDVEEAAVRILMSRVSSSVRTLVPPERRHELMPFTRWLADGGEALRGADIAAAQTRLGQATSSWLRLLTSFDVVLTPTTLAPPQPIGGLRFDDAEQSAAAMLRWSAFTPWANFSGAPAVSLPTYRTAAGLPIGVQLTARPGSDELLLSLAAALEESVRWQVVHPACW